MKKTAFIVTAGLVLAGLGSVGVGQQDDPKARLQATLKGRAVNDLRGLQAVWMISSVDPGSNKVDKAKFAFKGDNFFRLMEKVNTKPEVYRTKVIDEFQICNVAFTGKVKLIMNEKEPVADAEGKEISEPDRIEFFYNNVLKVRGFYKYDDQEMTKLRMCLAPAGLEHPKAMEADEKNGQVVFSLVKILDMKAPPMPEQ